MEEFHLGNCSNCGHDKFLAIENSEYPYLMLTPARKTQHGNWDLNNNQGMIVSAFTCASCREIKFFELRNK